MGQPSLQLEYAHPPVEPVLREARSRRILAGLTMTGSGGVLGLAAWLTPAEAGLGTHRQLLDLPACSWVDNFGMPCPTCGMTTAFSHAANGDFLASFLAQPLGLLLAIATASTCLVALYVVVTGSAVAGVFGRLWGMRAIWALIAMLVGSWVYKILLFREVI